jgi:hypothetical protein
MRQDHPVEDHPVEIDERRERRDGARKLAKLAGETRALLRGRQHPDDLVSHSDARFG